MKRHDPQNKIHHGLKHPALTAFALAVAIFSAAAATNWAGALYILTGTSDSAIVLSDTQKVPDLSSQLIHISSNASGYDILLEAGLPVRIQHGDTVLSTLSQRENVSQLLDRMKIFPSPLEMISVDLSDGTLKLTVAEEIAYYEEESRTVGFETVRVENPELLEGTENVLQEGKAGSITFIYEIVWSDGKQISRQLVEEVEIPAQNHIIEYGTAIPEPEPVVTAIGTQEAISQVIKNEDGSGTLVLESGATLNFTEAKSMTATAYTAGHDGADYVTATGTTVGIGTVAVDRRVIPLGTRMYIVTNDGIVYGLSVACDTGVRGDTVDLYHNTYNDCINFGRRKCTVYILEE